MDSMTWDTPRLADVKLRKLPHSSQLPKLAFKSYGINFSADLHTEQLKFLTNILFLSESSFSSIIVDYFFVVRSGEHVKLQDGGESVLWNITGGLD